MPPFLNPPTTNAPPSPHNQINQVSSILNLREKGRYSDLLILVLKEKKNIKSDFEYIKS